MRHAPLPALLILAISGRALAQAARRAGFAPLVADFFCDRDTREAAAGCARVDGDLALGFSAEAVMRALERLAEQASFPPVGLVYGAGIEAQPELIAQIAASWPVIGNDAETVRRVKQPRTFFGVLDNLRIAHPDVRFDPQSPLPGEWLLKRIGGAGGSHIKWLDGDAEIPIHSYAQAFVDGRSVSALILSDASGTRVLGFSEQWRAPAPDRPYRYGGAVQPAEIAPVVAERMTDIAVSIDDAFALRGLVSIDFMLTDDGPLVLEVNPRPGATLDIFDSDAHPLLAMHIAACESLDVSDCYTPALWNEAYVRQRAAGGEKGGASPAGSIIIETGPDARATQIVFARRQLTIPKDIIWPDWTADRPHDDETIPANRPVCTVRAEADTPAAARALAARRESAILESIEALQRA